MHHGGPERVSVRDHMGVFTCVLYTTSGAGQECTSSIVLQMHRTLCA